MQETLVFRRYVLVFIWLLRLEAYSLLEKVKNNPCCFALLITLLLSVSAEYNPHSALPAAI